jgi:hypothetical protein
MAADDPRDDIPEADRAEQERDAVTGFQVEPDDEAQTTSAIDTDVDIDPLKADEADQLDQAIAVPVDDEDYEQPVQ